MQRKMWAIALFASLAFTGLSPAMPTASAKPKLPYFEHCPVKGQIVTRHNGEEALCISTPVGLVWYVLGSTAPGGR